MERTAPPPTGPTCQRAPCGTPERVPATVRLETVGTKLRLAGSVGRARVTLRIALHEETDVFYSDDVTGVLPVEVEVRPGMYDVALCVTGSDARVGEWRAVVVGDAVSLSACPVSGGVVVSFGCPAEGVVVVLPAGRWSRVPPGTKKVFVPLPAPLDHGAVRFFRGKAAWDVTCGSQPFQGCVSW